MTGRVQKNLEYWERTSDEYQAAHGQTLTQTAKAWGVWRIPEADLNVLGDLEGKNVLELGCGAAQWSLALSDAGVGAVGLDLSERQLSHARNACREPLAWARRWPAENIWKLRKGGDSPDFWS